MTEVLADAADPKGGPRRRYRPSNSLQMVIEDASSASKAFGVSPIRGRVVRAWMVFDGSMGLSTNIPFRILDGPNVIATFVVPDSEEGEVFDFGDLDHQVADGRALTFENTAPTSNPVRVALTIRIARF